MFLTLILVINVTNLYSQDTSPWSFGLKAGINQTDNNFFHDGSNFKTRIESSAAAYGGVFTSYKLEDRINVQIDVMYSEYKFLNHLELSFLSSYSFFQDRLMLGGGLKFAKILENDFNRDDISNFNIGYEIGLEAPIFKGVFIESKVVYFSGNISGDRVGIFSDLPKRLDGFRIGMGYRF